MFDSLPIPHHIIYMLKYIYSNNSYEYQDFTISSTTGVRQGDGISPILFKLATEPLLRYVTKYRSLKLFDYKPHITTYADDSAILSNSENDMKLMLETLLDTSK